MIEMAIDWGYAVQVSIVGFTLVFAVLSILALAIWAVGLVLRRISAGEVATGDNKKKGA